MFAVILPYATLSIEYMCTSHIDVFVYLVPSHREIHAGIGGPALTMAPVLAFPNNLAGTHFCTKIGVGLVEMERLE